jgi:RNA polymerase sigma-70 factor (ECF subfamily)
VLDERAAVARARQGDHAAFEELVRRHQDAAFRVAHLIVRDPAEAQDVAQEAFVSAYRGLSRFDERLPFRPWLLRIVTNQALNVVRSAKRRTAMTERYERQVEGNAAAPSPERGAEAAELAQRLWRAVGALDERDQAVIYLHYFLDASEAETAAAIGRPRGTVKSRLHRALRKLRAVVEERYPDLAPAVERDPSESKA